MGFTSHGRGLMRYESAEACRVPSVKTSLIEGLLLHGNMLCTVHENQQKNYIFNLNKDTWTENGQTLHFILYKYWPRQSRWLTLIFKGWQFPMLPSLAVNIHIILNVNLKHCLHYVWFKNISCEVNIWVWISYSVNSNAHMTPVRIYGEPYAHKFCTVTIFLEYHIIKQYHLLLSSITC